MSITISNDDSTLEITRRPGGHANTTYDVRLLSGSWPSESLIDICDNKEFGGGTRHFGGRVTAINDVLRTVVVYVD